MAQRREQSIHTHTTTSQNNNDNSDENRITLAVVASVHASPLISPTAECVAVSCPVHASPSKDVCHKWDRCNGDA